GHRVRVAPVLNETLALLAAHPHLFWKGFSAIGGRAVSHGYNPSRWGSGKRVGLAARGASAVAVAHRRERDRAAVQTEPLGHLTRVAALLHDPVVLIDEHNLGHVLARFGISEHAVSNDDDHVTRVDVVGGGAVDAD